MTALPRRPMLAIACVLALGPAVSLGLSRFAYALLLPPMRDDLGWTYFAGGVLNTINAAGYLLGAFMTAGALEKLSPRSIFVRGMALTAIFLVAHGFFTLGPHLAVLRFASGAAAAMTFISGGLLAAQLMTAERESNSALVLGIYYGGTGVGIVLSAWLVPPLAARAVAHAWQEAWIALGACAAVATAIAAIGTRGFGAERPGDEAMPARVGLRRLAFALAAYFGFGLGYIGYMTFIVTLLREQGSEGGAIVAFYTLLGLAVVASSWLWAGLLQRHRGGGPMATLCALLAAATLLPVASAHPAAMFGSGLLFGVVFLSVVASTTALVRHNLPRPQWAGGIAAFTIVFALGQIVGPGAVGFIADAAGGLRAGLAVSAAALAAAALLAALQRPLVGRAG